MKNDWGEFMTLWMNGDPWKSTVVSDMIKRNRLDENFNGATVGYILAWMKRNGISPPSYFRSTGF